MRQCGRAFAQWHSLTGSSTSWCIGPTLRLIWIVSPGEQLNARWKSFLRYSPGSKRMSARSCEPRLISNGEGLRLHPLLREIRL